MQLVDVYSAYQLYCRQKEKIDRLIEELNWYGHTIAGGGPTTGYAKAGRKAETRWYAVTSPLIKESGKSLILSTQENKLDA